MRAAGVVLFGLAVAVAYVPVAALIVAGLAVALLVAGRQ